MWVPCSCARWQSFSRRRSTAPSIGRGSSWHGWRSQLGASIKGGRRLPPGWQQERRIKPLVAFSVSKRGSGGASKLPATVRPPAAMELQPYCPMVGGPTWTPRTHRLRKPYVRGDERGSRRLDQQTSQRVDLAHTSGRLITAAFLALSNSEVLVPRPALSISRPHLSFSGPPI